MPAFKVDTNELAILNNKLQRLHKSAMPVAVRGSLNDAAFDMKKEVPLEFSKKFTVRKRTFITSHTGVNKSPNTFKLSAMHAECGIIKGKSKAGDQLIYQELGGTISGKKSVPMKEVRTSKSHSKLVSKRFYLSSMSKVGRRGVIDKNKKRTIIKTDKAIKMVTSRGTWSTLYAFVTNARIKKRPFLKPAGDRAAKKIPQFYLKQAERQLRKYGITA